MKYQELIWAEKKAQRRAEKALGRVRLTLAHLNCLKKLKALHRAEMAEKQRRVAMIYGGKQIDTDERHSNQEVIEKLALSAMTEKQRLGRERRRKALNNVLD